MAHPSLVHPQDVPSLIKPLFPEHQTYLERLYDSNDEFREICQNLAECKAVLEHLLNCDPPNVDQVIEYRNILRALKAELVGILVDHY